MSYEFDLPEDLDNEGGKYLSEPGTYHLVIEQVNEGTGPNGKAIDGFSLECRVMAGTVAEQEGRGTTLTFWQPNLTGSEESQKATKRQNAALFVACNQVDPTQLGKRASIDIGKLQGEHMIVTLERRMDKDELTGKYTVPSKFLRINYASIYHVDDPDAAGFPKDAEALTTIDRAKRRPAEWFAFKSKKSAPAPKPKQETSDDFDNL
jgi:hypothetical protein